ncbi:MAG: HNH endonuclease [Patescibacteria group bacterium]|nr:HNH endonuclease [Patescibacteria group bacterium]
MTQVAKPSYEPVGPTPRKAFTVAEHRIIRERQGDVCAICGQRERAYQFDHVLPIELGGAHSVDNAQMLCLICHRHKTAVDVRRIRKAARLRKKADPATRTPPRI